jgi:hypothetical protein
MTASPSRRQAEPATDYISVERNFTEVCVSSRPRAELIAPQDASPCRNARHNDRILDACRFPAVSSRPRKTVRWDLVEIAASRTEEGDRELLCNDCLDGKSIRQCERGLTLCPRTADHPRWVETHLWQVLQSVGVIMTPSHAFGALGRQPCS